MVAFSRGRSWKETGPARFVNMFGNQNSVDQRPRATDGRSSRRNCRNDFLTLRENMIFVHSFEVVRGSDLTRPLCFLGILLHPPALPWRSSNAYFRAPYLCSHGHAAPL